MKPLRERIAELDQVNGPPTQGMLLNEHVLEALESSFAELAKKVRNHRFRLNHLENVPPPEDSVRVPMLVLVRPDGEYQISERSQPPHWVDEVAKGAVVHRAAVELPRPVEPPVHRAEVEE